MKLGIVYQKSDGKIQFFIEDVERHGETEVIGKDSFLKGLDPSILAVDVVDCSAVTEGTETDPGTKYTVGSIVYSDGSVYSLTAAELLEREKQKKIKELNDRCDYEIYQGFTATVNGHRYGAKLHDQINFLGTKTELDADPNKTSVDFKAEDLGYMIPHTRDEFLQVFSEGMAFVKGLIAHANARKEIAIKATTVAEVEVIVW
jgi:hypothetical protein